MPLRILSGQKPLQMSGLGGAPVFGETFGTASRPDGFMLSDQTDTDSKAVGKREASYIDSDKSGSKWMREQVLEARKRQQMRCRGAAMRENGRLSPGEILKYCPLGLEEQEFLEQASEQAGLSMRGCHRVIRVARTIADLEGKDRIGVEHLGQALFFRNQNVLRE